MLALRASIPVLLAILVMVSMIVFICPAYWLRASICVIICWFASMDLSIWLDRISILLRPSDTSCAVPSILASICCAASLTVSIYFWICSVFSSWFWTDSAFSVLPCVTCSMESCIWFMEEPISRTCVDTSNISWDICLAVCMMFSERAADASDCSWIWDSFTRLTFWTALPATIMKIPVRRILAICISTSAIWEAS